ncbi:DUF881 domain-containing protein [Lutispora saccharofermentans]|uniref:DUF881 domain-containing protein n=1 Tax=Lutispora saccharofermentans TaxID=3024236 RepID=A0ABT1NCS2_9FIRM|nr:DUF881 domain-containing protein [Lutispora saccharofermentans]MCQ1528126.1 DUF881 domain-containing protein [Lutispora saccharofermentans]
MKNIKMQLAIGVVCLVLGIMVAVQFKTVKNNVGPVTEYRARELASQLKRVTTEKDNLAALKNELEKKLRDYENAEAEGNSAAKFLSEELNKARIIAGLVDVEGPGITMLVDDLKFTEHYNYNIIDYTDLLELVNELNAAGAEAISINGQRVISTTEIRQAGLHININTVKFAPPFTFKAIGDPKTLEAALRMRDGIIQRIEGKGIAISITQEQSIIVKKYDGVIEKKFSKVVKEGETR